MGFLLMDCQAANAASPETFEIPELNEVYGIDEGDLVKLIFLPEDGVGGERMWVEVTSIGVDMLRGRLRNHPFLFDEELAYDDEVVFHRRHVADIDREE